MKLPLPLLFLTLSASLVAADYETHILPVFPDGYYTGIAVGDTDGDHKNELVEVSSLTHSVRIARVNHDASVQLLQEIALPPLPDTIYWQYTSPTIVDMNNDGANDIVVWARANGARGYIVLLERSGNSWRLSSYPTPETDSSYGMAIADINGDGLQDVITANHGFASAANLFVSYNAANPSRFSSFTTHPSGSARIVYVYAVDLDHDGDADIAATTHPFGTPGLVILKNNGSGLAPATLLSGPSVTLTAGFGDLDRDGTLDIFTSDGEPYGYSGDISIYRNPGGYSLQRLFTGSEARSPKLFDMDGDGLSDLVMDNALDHVIEVVRGGSPTDLSGDSFRISSAELSDTDHGERAHSDPLLVADVDNDGKPDLLFNLSRTIWIRRAPVSLSACILYDPAHVAKAGATIPVKLQLCDANGANLSSPAETVMAVSISLMDTNAPQSLQNAGNSNADGAFRFDPTLGGTGGYIYNLKTSGLAPGEYRLNITLGAAHVPAHVPFRIR